MLEEIATAGAAFYAIELEDHRLVATNEALFRCCRILFCSFSPCHQCRLHASCQTKLKTAIGAVILVLPVDTALFSMQTLKCGIIAHGTFKEAGTALAAACSILWFRGIVIANGTSSQSYHIILDSIAIMLSMFIIDPFRLHALSLTLLKATMLAAVACLAANHTFTIAVLADIDALFQNASAKKLQTAFAAVHAIVGVARFLITNPA